VNENGAGAQFEKLLGVMAELRGEQGCPWDKQQTHVSLKPCLLEETYELLEALDEGDPKKLREELGDLLLQVVFHSQIAGEEGSFTMEDVVRQLIEKLVRRHPYVFAGEPLPDSAAAVLKQRLQIKANEKKDAESKSALGNVPKAMPALARAQSVSRRAAHVGFEWPDIAQVWEKVEEEIRELKEATAEGGQRRTGEELGDLLFTMVNVARFLDVEAEEVLAQTVDRFTRRFHYVEAKIRAENKALEQVSLAEMERYWQEAKQIEAREKSRS
jgi:tetrapyrrole methylase family protein/MazG family protein